MPVTDVRTARFLGFFSLGLGVAELVAAGPMSRVLGLWGERGIVRAFGAREVGTGLYILSNDDHALGMWGRVAGDALDLGLLAAAAAKRNRRSENALVALAMVAGITALDIAVAVSLTRRDATALATAQKTRLPSRNRPARVRAAPKVAAKAKATQASSAQATSAAAAI